jgi:hypothetical protein
MHGGKQSFSDARCVDRRFGETTSPMAIATSGTASNYLRRAPSPSGLAEVLDVILDKGLVIDVSVISSLPESR